MFVWFLLWVVTGQCIIFAFYLAATRCAYGWFRTVGAYLLVFAVPAAVDFLIEGPHQVPLGNDMSVIPNPIRYVAFFVVWCAVTIALSKGALGRRVFTAFVCGVHQIGAFAFSLIALSRLRPAAAGGIVACLIMGGMGVFLIRNVLPRLRRMTNSTGWRELNLTALMNFALLFVTGVWPSHVPTGGWNDIFRFVVANVVAVVYFPVALSFAERHRAEYLVRQLSDNARVLQADLAAVRASEDGARRLRHDTRHHVEVLRGLLQDGQAAAALHYLDNTLSHELLLPPHNTHLCENALVNAILTVGSRRARAKGLEFLAETNAPAVLKIGEVDLVSLLGNLLENAVNCAAGGAVHVTVFVDRGALRVGVTNRVAEGFALQNGLPCEHPGVGILSARAVVEKHRGLCDYELNGNELTARVMIGGVS